MRCNVMRWWGWRIWQVEKDGRGGEKEEDNYKGEKIAHFPYNIEPENVTPVYQDFKGWKQDLTGMTTYDELPIELKEYIEFIEREVEVPIKIVSVGPDRKQTILK